MTLPDEESIQEGLARLNEPQRLSVGSPAGAGPALDRDARVLNTLSEVRGWTMASLTVLLPLCWAFALPESDAAVLYLPASIGAWACGAGFVVSSSAMALMLILNPVRYQQAWARNNPQHALATDGPPLDRDATALLTIRRLVRWSVSAGLLLLLFWGASPAGTDLTWIGHIGSVGAWMLGASFVVSTAALGLIVILSPSRYRRARGLIAANRPPAPERPPRDRDARVLFRVVSVCVWSMVAGTFVLLPLAYWSSMPSGADLRWLAILVSVGAWTLGTSFVVSTAAIALLFILNPRRYWRAWVQIRGDSSGAGLGV